MNLRFRLSLKSALGLSSAAIVLLLAACATSGGGGVVVGGGQAPSWVSVPPAPSQQYNFFVGSGSDPSGALSGAQRRAEASLVAEIVRFVGGEDRSKLTATQAGELARFEQQVGAEVSAPPATGQPDVAVVDRFVQHKGAGVTVHLLGRCLSGVLHAEQQRLHMPGGEVDRGKPETSGQQGEEPVAEGTPIEAAKAYIAAAVAAGGREGSDTGTRIARDIRRAEEAVGEINLDKLTDALHGRIHQSLPSPFRLRVTAADGTPLPGIAIRATYKTAEPTGILATVVDHLRTDASGVAELSLPPLTFVGSGKVSMAVDLEADIAPLESLGASYRPIVARLVQTVQSKSVEFGYSATSESAAIRTGVLIVDVDGSGNFIWGDATTSGVVETLAPLGFKLTSVPGNPSVVGIDDPDLLMIVRNNFGGQFRRVMLGQAVITAFRQEAGGGYRVEVSGKLKVTDLATGSILASASHVASGSGATAVSAINTAFSDLGARLAFDVANRLP